MGLGAVLLTAAPAAAAPGDVPPTISAPTTRVGYGTVTITGTARPGAVVRLFESAYNWNDLQPAIDWDNGQQPVAATTGADGRYQFVRPVDTGFLFAAEADGLRSRTHLVSVQVLPMLTVAARADGVDVHVIASPNQPFLEVQIQRAISADTWATVAQGFTDGIGTYATTLPETSPGPARFYRAWIGGDTETSITSNYSVTHQLGNGTAPAPPDPPAPPLNPPAPPAPPAPPVPPAAPPAPPVPPAAPPAPPAAPPAPAKPPAPPAKPLPAAPPVSKPTRPVAPAKPAPAHPGPGTVQFTTIRYDSPGRDTGSNASRNGEWVRLTNRTSRMINLRNWTIRDAAGHVYRFTANHFLGAGRSVQVHTGRGANGRPAGHRYWGSGRYIWNNSRDTATLRNSANRTVDTCRWTTDRNVTNC